jgi:hypothetical protein
MTIARLTVQRGDLTEFPLAERTKNGWQNGVTFYPDAEVVKAVELRAVAAGSEPMSEYLAPPTEQERQALADVVKAADFSATDEAETVDEYWRAWKLHMADAILAAGFRRPIQQNSEEEAL